MSTYEGVQHLFHFQEIGVKTIIGGFLTFMKNL
jgi:hypothetical protein